MSRARAKGTSWESAIVAYLRENGAPHAERRTLAGAQDRGDIAGVPGIVFEAKNAAKVELAGWLDEAEVERDNARAAHGVVWFKRRGHTSPGAGFVLMSGQTLVTLLLEAGYLTTPALPAALSSPAGIRASSDRELLDALRDLVARHDPPPALLGEECREDRCDKCFYVACEHACHRGQHWDLDTGWTDNAEAGATP